MPLTRGEAVGYDADLMAFKFTMRNGKQIVQCQISNAALGNLAGRWRGAARDVPAKFEAHRELIEAIASELFDQTSTRKETSLVRISAKHISTAQRGRKDTDQNTDPEDAFGEDRMGSSDHRPTFAARTRHLPPPMRLGSKKG
jgi:Protein of unknown function (DUF1488)